MQSRLFENSEGPSPRSPHVNYSALLGCSTSSLVSVLATRLDAPHPHSSFPFPSLSTFFLLPSPHSSLFSPLVLAGLTSAVAISGVLSYFLLPPASSPSVVFLPFHFVARASQSGFFRFLYNEDLLIGDSLCQSLEYTYRAVPLWPVTCGLIVRHTHSGAEIILDVIISYTS